MSTSSGSCIELYDPAAPTGRIRLMKRYISQKLLGIVEGIQLDQPMPDVERSLQRQNYFGMNLYTKKEMKRLNKLEQSAAVIGQVFYCLFSLQSDSQTKWAEKDTYYMCPMCQMYVPIIEYSNRLSIDGEWYTWDSMTTHTLTVHLLSPGSRFVIGILRNE